MEHKRDIVLLCNPTAGGRWKELASILDSDEARFVRRVVTDSIEDIVPAIVALSRRTKLLCVYGGDGTIQRVLDALHASPGAGEPPPLAFIGGGTMNVGARWCGLTHSPERNFRSVVSARFPVTYWGFRYGLRLIGKRASLPPPGLINAKALARFDISRGLS